MKQTIVKTFKATVRNKETKEIQIMEFKRTSKKAVLDDLKGNNYCVIENSLKEKELYDWIAEHSEMADTKDEKVAYWMLTQIPVDEQQEKDWISYNMNRIANGRINQRARYKAYGRRGKRRSELVAKQAEERLKKLEAEEKKATTKKATAKKTATKKTSTTKKATATKTATKKTTTRKRTTKAQATAAL